MRALGGVHLYVANSGLPSGLVDLVYLRVSQINGCAYCIAAHSRDLLNEKTNAEKLFLLSAWRESGSVFTERERAALQWAEAVTAVSATHVPDADFAAVATQYSEQEIADLTIGIALNQRLQPHRNQLSTGAGCPAVNLSLWRFPVA